MDISISYRNGHIHNPPMVCFHWLLGKQFFALNLKIHLDFNKVLIHAFLFSYF